MNTAPFEYASPRTMGEVLSLLSQTADARVVAGGQSLLPEMKTRHLSPSLLIDLRNLEELHGVSEASGALRIGATTTLREILASDAVRGRYHALVEAILACGDPQVRNRATLGGNLVQSRYPSDLAAAVLAYGASVHTAAASEPFPAEAFFTGPGSVALQRSDVITAVAFPALGASTGAAYLKQRKTANNGALCGVAARVELGPDRAVTACTVAVVGASEYPQRLAAVESALAGSASTPEALREAARQAGTGYAAPTDRHGSAEYRHHLAQVLTERALARAVQRADGRR
jgi:carbon-monoxide dehydrogenase medium subunit